MRNIFSYKFLFVVAVILGLAPLFPQPHLVEKAIMLFEGRLSRPIDIFDLVWHSRPILFLAGKAGVDLKNRNR